MNKTYKTKYHGFNIIVTVNGEKKNLTFKRDFIGIATMIGCIYSTDDVELQKAIEAHKGFNKDFWTDDVEEIKEEKSETPVVEKKRSKKAAANK